MHNRNLVVPGLLVLVSLACAGPSAQDATSAGETPSRELTLPPPAESGAGVASDLEVRQPVEPELPAVPQVQRQARAPRAARPAVVEVAALRTPVEAAATDALDRTVDPPLRAAPSPEPAAAAGDAVAAGPSAEGVDDVAAEPRAGRRPGVIIRGGVIEDDDCALHRPQDGVMTIPPPDALVNDRAPRVGLTGGQPGARTGADPRDGVVSGPRLGAGSPARGPAGAARGRLGGGRMGGGLRGGF